MSMNQSALSICGLELPVRLGWEENERREKQMISLDIDICFSDKPKACDSDQLNDTVCYAALIESIRQITNEKAFHLIEHLAQTIYAAIQSQLPTNTRLKLRITKHPMIQGLTRGVCFSLGEG